MTHIHGLWILSNNIGTTIIDTLLQLKIINHLFGIHVNAFHYLLHINHL